MEVPVSFLQKRRFCKRKLVPRSRSERREIARVDRERVESVGDASSLELETLHAALQNMNVASTRREHTLRSIAVDVIEEEGMIVEVTFYPPSLLNITFDLLMESRHSSDPDRVVCEVVHPHSLSFY